MEYKYHPIYKYGVFFILTYTFLRHQELMEHNLLLLNCALITIFVMIVDQMFIHNHITIVQPLSDQYFDQEKMAQLDIEIKREEKKKKKNKKNKKNAESDGELGDELVQDDVPENECTVCDDATPQQDDLYYEEDDFQVQRKPPRYPNKQQKKHFTFYEPTLGSGFTNEIMAYNS